MTLCTTKNSLICPDSWKLKKLFQCFLYLIQIFGAARRRRAAILSEVSQRNLQIVKAAGISSLYLSSHYYAKCLLLSLIQGYINVQGTYAKKATNHMPKIRLIWFHLWSALGSLILWFVKPPSIIVGHLTNQNVKGPSTLQRDGQMSDLILWKDLEEIQNQTAIRLKII